MGNACCGLSGDSLRGIPSDRIHAIIRESPGSVIDILAGTVQQLFRKLPMEREMVRDEIARIFALSLEASEAEVERYCIPFCLQKTVIK